MFGRSVNSAKFSGDALNDKQTGAGSSGVTANIFPPTLNTRSQPHCICSVEPGNDRHNLRSQSMSIRPSLCHQHGSAQLLPASPLRVKALRCGFFPQKKDPFPRPLFHSLSNQLLTVSSEWPAACPYMIGSRGCKDSVLNPSASLSTLESMPSRLRTQGGCL